jgi:LPXTG-motif cell wall-anchored protein
VASGSAPSAVAAAPQLPYTGARTGLVALAGGGLLLAGAVLRLRLRDASGRR